MKFLADMGISMRTVRWLRDIGYDVVHLRERKQSTISDVQIMYEAYCEDRIVLTMDLDFGYLLAISGKQLPSVIIFRLDDERPNNINKRLKGVLEQSSEALLRGAIVSIHDDKHRVRLLPIHNR